MAKPNNGNKSSASQQTSKSLAARVTALEANQGLSHETKDFIDRATQTGGSTDTASSRAFNRIKMLSSDAVAPAQVVDLSFDLSNTPKPPGMVRLYQSGSTSDIASSQSLHGTLPRQVVGSDLTLIMDIIGNPGETGSFSVKCALPSSISLSVEDGPTSIKYLHVTG